MPQTDTKRIWHDLEDDNNSYRTGNLYQILNDTDEEETGAGFSEVIRAGAFVTDIIVWTDSGKTQKRSHTTFDRTGPFVNQIQKQFYNDVGSVVATVTATVSRNASNSVTDVFVSKSRP